jgi:signal transduction histidine kinase
MKIDWLTKLQTLLLVTAFCLAVAAIQIAFQPDRSYGPPAAYSLCIGFFTWATVDLGRHAFPSSAETGWPQGWAGAALVLIGILAGYVLGNLLGDTICRVLHFEHRGAPLDAVAEARNGMLITVIAGVAASYYLYSINMSAYLVRKMAEAGRQANESRLRLLEAQLEPHMLFNTLANLRALIAVDPLRAQTMLDHMIAYLRATLSASRATGAKPHTLHDEFARLGDYLELMAIRMGPRLQFSLELPDALAHQPVPALLLQPLVENSIQHGLEPQVAGGSITVRARQQGDLLQLEVADTGLGMATGQDTAPAPGRSGFGLQQVRERLATTYGSLGALKIVAAPAGGTLASITFPLQT